MTTRKAHSLLRAFGLASSLAAVQAVSGQEFSVCGPIDVTGAMDYRTASAQQHALVEGAHFTFNVESLRRGNKQTAPGPDIDYTLRLFPNHHRALLSMMNLGLRENRPQPHGSRYTVECWMVRGERWRPDDGVVKMLYGTYLLRVGRRSEALSKLDAAEKLIKDDPGASYNLGLAYFGLERYDQALSCAHKAYAQNYPLPGLRNKLRMAGYWQEAKPEASAPASEASPAR